MKSKYHFKFLYGRVAALSALAFAAAPTVFAPSPASAAVLEQKWQAGQQLSYDVNVNGTVHLTAPADAPMIGGLPLEIMLKGDGQNTLDTRDVDEFGTAIVAVRLDHMQLKMNETTFNQNGVLGIRDGRANFSLNGQPIMPARDVSQWLAPRYGMRITRQFHIVGTAPLQPSSNSQAGAADTDKNADKKDAADSAMRIPLDMAMMLQAMMARSLPSLWPTKDIQIGDTWKADVQWPQTPNAPRAELQKPAGEFDLKALGEEEVLGRKTLRIALDGTFKVDEAQSRIFGEEIEKRRAEGKENPKENTGAKTNAAPGGLAGFKLPKLAALTQTVKGDLWFDVAAGQIVRTDLQLNSTAQTRKDEKSKADGNFDFAGNLKMELRKVTYEGKTSAG